MAVRRRLYKTRAWAERLYMAGCGGTHDEKKTAAVADDDDVYGSTAELLAPLEVMHRSLVAVGDRILADGALLNETAWSALVGMRKREARDAAKAELAAE